MGCYAVPLVAGIVHSVMRKRNGWNDKHDKVLNWLLWGGAVFGVVDHAWNRELFAFSYQDLLLGVAITVSIFLIAGGMLLADKMKAPVKVRA
jgi:hypothetical protein